MPADDEVTRDGEPRPEAPDSLPQYLVDALVRQDVESLEDAIRFAEELHQWKLHPTDEDDTPSLKHGEVVSEDPDTSKWDWILKEHVKCGDETCKCMKQDRRIHGPYYYKARRTEDGTLKKEYIKKQQAKKLA
jgi:hypothetical protein